MRLAPPTLRYRRLTVLVVGLVLALVACSSDGAETRPASLPAVTTTTTAEATTTTAVTTTTTTTTTSTTVPNSDAEPLVLVAFGDSVLGYPSSLTGAIGAYADMLEEEFGVPVDVRDNTVWGSPPSQLLNALDSERVLADLAEADVVLLEIPQGDTAPPFMTVGGYQGRDPVDCGGDDQRQCLRDYVTENKATVEAIFSALTGVCDPSEVLIRVIDVYQMEIESQNETDSLQITSPYFREAQEALANIAATYGIPVAPVHAEFMGPDRTEDPQERGLIGTDQRHPTRAGAELIAKMLDALGYEPAA
jgi:lysophospholipase L1-like esterase